MKKALSFVLAVMMLCTLMLPAAAETTAVTISLVPSATEVNIGDTFTVDVTVTENHYIVNGQIQITYDPTALELQEVWDDPDCPYFEEYNTAILNSKYLWAFKVPVAGQANMAFASSGTAGTTAGGTIYTLTFKVLDAAKASNAITLTVPEMCSNNSTRDNIVADYDTDPALVNATVTVAGVVTKGDIDGNGKVELVDALQLFYHVNNKIVIDEAQLPVADIDGSGTIELVDALQAFYFVNNKISAL